MPSTAPAEKPPPTQSLAQLQRDRTIASSVRYELDTHGIDTSVVAVTCEGGHVRLVGKVKNLLARDRAQRLARSVPGVRDVSSHLHVDRASLDDATLKVRIEDLLLSDPAAEHLQLHIIVEEGEVTLLGTVDTWHEKRNCEVLTMSVRGVRAVENDIVVQRPLIDDREREPLVTTTPRSASPSR